MDRPTRAAHRQTLRERALPGFQALRAGTGLHARGTVRPAAPPLPRLVLPASEKFPQFLRSPSDTPLFLLGTLSSSLPDVPPSLLPQLIHDIYSRAFFQSPPPAAGRQP